MEFLVLHYSAGLLKPTIDILCDPQREIKVSSQLVLDVDGTVYELMPYLDGSCLRARHAGLSWLEQEGKRWEAFNDFAIGIEIINLNGNIFPFTDQQYTTLAQLLPFLAHHYPALTNPTRIVGHEQIAGWRGKSDPGRCFDWPRMFREAYPGGNHPAREPICPALIAESLSKLATFAPTETDPRYPLFFHTLSSLLEQIMDKRPRST